MAPLGRRLVEPDAEDQARARARRRSRGSTPASTPPGSVAIRHRRAPGGGLGQPGEGLDRRPGESRRMARSGGRAGPGRSARRRRRPARPSVRSSSSAACRPRVVELVQDVRHRSRALPTCSPRPRPGRRARRSRRTGGSRRRTPSNRIRRSRRTAVAKAGPRRARRRAVSASTIAPRTWLRTCSPRSATSSETARIASARSRVPAAEDPRTGSGTSTATAPDRSARRSSRPGRGVIPARSASASSAAARATSGSAWIAA